MAIEQPEYEVVDQLETVEIRRYQPMNVARTLVNGDFESVGNTGFRRLAGYIFGGNSEEQKIAMTSPVTQERDEGEAYWINFMMPKEYDLTDLPAPEDATVEVVELPSRTLAALRYKGGWSEKKYREHEQELIATIQGSSQWKIDGEATWARYNSPLMLPFLRTNEVLVPVAPLD